MYIYHTDPMNIPRQYRMECCSTSVWRRHEALTVHLACTQVHELHTAHFSPTCIYMYRWVSIMHVHRTWRDHIKATKQEHQIELYQMLCLLEGELESTSFQQLLSHFTAYWSFREPEFVKLFEKYYANRPATCIHVHLK